MKIKVDRETFEIGDVSYMPGQELRALVGVADDYDLWYEGNGSHDTLVQGGLVFFGSEFSHPRFRTSPRIIS